MGQMTDVTRTRLESIDRATSSLLGYDIDNKIEHAQMELEFDEGIKVANEVMAEFIADLRHLSDYHGQDFEEILARAGDIYVGHYDAEEAAGS